MRKNKIVVFFLCIIILLPFIPANKSHAATGSADISVSSGTVNVGERVTVSVTIRASDEMGCEGTVVYDPAILQLEQGDTHILDYSNYAPEKTYSFVFTAITAGNATVSVRDVVISMLNTDNEDVVLAGVCASAAVSVVQPIQPALSSEAYLTGLVTSLGQVDVSAGSWTLYCDYNTTTFAINPSVSANASWAASGDFNNLRVGANQFVIIVTAQDGVTKHSYPITVVRADGPAASSSSEETESASETETEETSTEEQPLLAVDLMGGNQLYAVTEFDGTITLPDGFTETQQMVEGGYAAAAVNDGGLILLYLVDEDGKNGAFYVYDTDTKTAYPFVTAKQPQDSIIFLEKPDSEEVPNGYEETALSVGEEEITAYRKTGSEEELYLVYGMNQDGETGWYWYHGETGAFFPYSDDSEGQDEALAALQSQLDESRENYEHRLKSQKIWLIVLLVLVLVSVVVAGVAILALMASRRKSYEQLTDEDLPEEETEEAALEENAQGPSQESLPKEEEAAIAEALEKETAGIEAEEKESIVGEETATREEAPETDSKEEGKTDPGDLEPVREATGDVVIDFAADTELTREQTDDDLEVLDLDDLK